MISRDDGKEETHPAAAASLLALPALKHAPNLTPDGGSTDVTTTICHDVEAPDDDDDSWKRGKNADDKRVTDRCLRREILKVYDSYCAEKKEQSRRRISGQ